MSYTLPIYDKFNVHSEGAVALRWEKWLRRLENLFVALNISDKRRKRALLLHYAGEEVQDIFDTLENTGNQDDYTTATQKLTEYFNPKKMSNLRYTISEWQNKGRMKTSLSTTHD